MEFKLNNSVSDYLLLQASTSFPSCCHALVKLHVSVASPPTPISSTLQLEPSGDNTILPQYLILALLKAISPTDLGVALRLMVTNTGATDHMLPDWTAFISYKLVHNLRMCMGNNSSLSP